MVDTKFSDFPVNVLLAALFLIAIVGFGIGVANNYGGDSSLVDSEYLNVSDLEVSLQETNENAEEWQSAFREEDINNKFILAGTLLLGSIWSIGGLIWDAIRTIFNIFIGGMLAIGVPPVVTGTIITVLVIGLMFSLWRVIKVGE